VPLKSRGEVVKALEQRGFRIEEIGTTIVAETLPSHSSATESLPSTPPPSTLAELQKRTFDILKKQQISPQVYPDIRLVLCAGQRRSQAADDAMYLGLVKCFCRKPKFLSLTLTDTEPPSIFLEKEFIVNFPSDSLLGNRDDILIPIVLDLRQLPLESTGIVCGVAGKLAGGDFCQVQNPVEMSYLSTAKSGSVMVAEDELERAVSALNS
jgi:hypothetical protein